MIDHYKRDLLVLTLGKAFQVVLSLATLRLTTEILNEEQIGAYFILLTVVSLLAFGLFNPLGQYYGRHIIQWKQSQNLKTATNVMLALRTISIPFALIIAFMMFYLFNYQKYFNALEYGVFIFITLIALIHGVLLNATNALINRYTFTKYSVLTLAVGLALSLLFTRLSPTAMAWIYGLALTQITFSFILYRLIVKENHFSAKSLKYALSMKYIKGVFYYILPVTITLFLQWGQTASFRIIVEDLYTIEGLASIAVGMALSGSIFAALESLATQFYMPIYLKKITGATKRMRTQAWNELADIMIPIYVATALYVIVFAPYLAKVLIADKFFETYIFAMIGAVIELLRVSTNLVYLVSQSEVKTKTTMTPYLLGISIMILGLYSVDISDSLLQVPTILAISYLVTLLTMFINMKKLLNIKINIWLPTKTLLLTTPIIVVLFVSTSPSFMNALVCLILGSAYLFSALYLILRNKFNKMREI
jgi:O-antigen/teichoic acid export membrane protein